MSKYEISILRKEVDYWIFDFKCKNFEGSEKDESFLFVSSKEPKNIITHIDTISKSETYTPEIVRDRYLLCTEEKLLAMPIGKEWVL